MKKFQWKCINYELNHQKTFLLLKEHYPISNSLGVTTKLIFLLLDNLHRYK